MALRLKSYVHTGDVFDDIEDAVEQGIKSGRRGIRSELEDKAQERLRETGAIWKGEIYNNFRGVYLEEGNQYWLVFKNDAEHAAPIEFGAEYDMRGPPVAALIPWVQTKMRGFSIPDDDQLSGAPDIEAIREQAREEAINKNMVNAVSLAEPEVVKKAFWLQQHIKENGIDAVRYMRAAELWAEANGASTVARYLNIHLARKL